MIRTAPVRTLPTFDSKIATDAQIRRRSLTRNSAPLATFQRARLEVLDELGIDNSAIREARKHLDRYDELRRELREQAGSARLDRGELVQRVAAGKLSAATAAERVAEATSPEVTRAAEQAESILREARDEALYLAAKSIRDHGEAAWIAELREVIAACLAEPGEPGAQQRFDLAYKAAGLLIAQPPGARSLADNRRAEQRFADAGEAVYYAQLNAAKSYAEAGRGKGADGIVRQVFKPIDPPKLTLARIAEHADEWKPGLYSAEHAVEQVRACRKREDRAAAGRLTEAAA